MRRLLRRRGCMARGFAGCAGGMLLSAACRPAVVKSCAGMGTASLWSPLAGWLFCADARVFLYGRRSYAPWQVQLFRVAFLSLVFSVPSQLVFVICFDSAALSTNDQRCPLLFSAMFPDCCPSVCPRRGCRESAREIKVFKGHDKRRQGRYCRGASA